MKKLIVLLVAFSLSMSVSAKSLRDLWLSMPDSLLPTFNKNLRLEFVELKDLGVKPEVKNLLGDNCLIDTLSNDYLQMATSQQAVLQMKMLPMEDSDSILCVVKTFSAPEKESDVRFYDQDWHEIARKNFVSDDAWEGLTRYFKSKPDTMSTEKYEEMFRMVEPVMVSANLSLDDETLTFSLSLPLVSKEEKEALNALIVQRKFKWNRKRFNEN